MEALAMGSMASTLASLDKVMEMAVRFCTVTEVWPALKVKY